MSKDDSDNPLILAIETSGRLGSVALAQGDRLLADRRFSGPMRHSAEVFPSIVGLLEQFGKKPDQIGQVHISVGPGSFTGLRIAVTIAKSMALANQAKIVAVDTLDVIAANVVSSIAETTENALKPDERLATILDAKRNQFFIAVYEKTQDATWQKILPDCLMTADEFRGRFANEPACGERSRTVALIGEGLVYHKDKFAGPNVRILDEGLWYPSATNVYRLGRQKARLGDFAEAVSLVPYYLRRPDAKPKPR